jgi:PAS domain S-box-containing protein
MEQMAQDLKKALDQEKWAKEVIEEAKAKDEAFLGSIGDGIIAVDKDGKISFINKAAGEMLKLKNQEVVGKRYDQILEMENEKGEPVPNEKRPLTQALISGKKVVTVASEGSASMVYYIRNDKIKFPAAITVTPVFLEGKIIGAVDVFRDVTIERQLDKSKSEFVSLASHQLRAPLTAIKWYSEILLKKFSAGLDAKQKRSVKEIYNGNERMISLIDIMLNISRFEAGKIKINPVKVNVKNVINSIIKEQNFEIKKKKQEVAFDCPENILEIITDQNLLRLIFQNLISNAIKYTPDSGSIKIKTEDKGGKLFFKVSDNGIGIPKDQQKRIFEKLFRADNASAQSAEGNGLGLYAAKMTTEHLGGKIWFESETGKGTTFFVELPIAK